MRKSVKILWFTTLGGMGLFILMLLLVNFGVIGTRVSLEALENPGSVMASEIITEDNTLVGKYYEVNRSYANYDAISKNVINGLIVMEDLHFYDHMGIDRKTIMNLPLYLLMGKTKYGSGTLTMQLARQLLASNTGGTVAANVIDASLQRMQEWLLTVKLERHFTKQEIIALRLNTALFGDTIHGIENAARTFFGKDAGHLCLAEAATLIGMLRGKKLYNPFRNPNISLLRRNVVIEQMEIRGFITGEEADEAKSRPIALCYSEGDYIQGLAPYVRDVLREKLITWCEQHKKANGSTYNLYEDGLKIYISADTGMRMDENEAASHHLQGLQSTINQRSNAKIDSVWYRWSQWNEMDTAITAIDLMSKPFYIIRIEDRYGNTLQTSNRSAYGCLTQK